MSEHRPFSFRIDRLERVAVTDPQSPPHLSSRRFDFEATGAAVVGHRVLDQLKLSIHSYSTESRDGHLTFLAPTYERWTIGGLGPLPEWPRLQSCQATNVQTGSTTTMMFSIKPVEDAHAVDLSCGGQRFFIALRSVGDGRTSWLSGTYDDDRDQGLLVSGLVDPQSLNLEPRTIGGV